MYNYYNNSYGIVKYCNIISDNIFRINNGVKQGGILSPTLFNIYIEDLLSEVLVLNVGYHAYDLNLSIIAYCDDILLMSRTERDLKKLICICEEYSRKWHIKFNANKSNLLSINNQITEDNVKIKINDIMVNYVTEFKYLGLHINDKLEYHSQYIKKFEKIQRSYLSLYNYGTSPNGVNPQTR